jgi:tetratricopeptide (TPR) repeat protein
MWGYRSSDVAKMLGLSIGQVRSYARAGFVAARHGDRGELRFSFQDLVLLRTASGLLRARIPPRRVRTALRKLREQLPDGRPLAGVRVLAQGDSVVVRDERGMWQPESGQVLFDFDVSDLAQRVAPLIRQASRGRETRKLDAEQWYEWGCDLEDGAPEQARDAYKRALRLDPDHAGANLNLGRLLHEDGDPKAAEERYRRALAASPSDGVARYNLGVALEDQGRREEALASYRQALALDHGCADAHFNAARLCQLMGRLPEAIRHLQAYRRLTQDRQR